MTVRNTGTDFGQSDTPETDWAWCYENPKEAAALIDRLERERDTMREDMKMLQMRLKLYEPISSVDGMSIEQWRDEAIRLRQRNEVLEGHVMQAAETCEWNAEAIGSEDEKKRWAHVASFLRAALRQQGETDGR
jgi:hypothetical protein